MTPSKFSSAAAVLLAAVPMAHALGSFSVKNGCSQAIKLSVTKGADNPESLGEVGPNETSDKYPYEVMGEGFGVNYAICPSDKDLSKSMLFEYSVKSGRVWFDLSNIVVSDEYPELFQNGGISIVPSQPHGDSCNPVVCPPGSKQCHEAYWQSDDNWAVKNCDQSQDTVLETCSGSGSIDSGSGSNDSGSGSDSDGSSGGYVPTPPPAPQYQPSSTLATSASVAPPANNYAEDTNQDNKVKVDSDGKAYVGEKQGADTTVVVPAYETKIVMAPAHQRHRRHAHGHAHHHE